MLCVLYNAFIKFVEFAELSKWGNSARTHSQRFTKAVHVYAVWLQINSMFKVSLFCSFRFRLRLIIIDDDFCNLKYIGKKLSNELNAHGYDGVPVYGG